MPYTKQWIILLERPLLWHRSSAAGCNFPLFHHAPCLLIFLRWRNVVLVTDLQTECKKALELVASDSSGKRFKTKVFLYFLELQKEELLFLVLIVRGFEQLQASLTWLCRKVQSWVVSITLENLCFLMTFAELSNNFHSFPSSRLKSLYFFQVSPMCHYQIWL